MPEYRVEFPDGEAWGINVKGKRAAEGDLNHRDTE